MKETRPDQPFDADRTADQYTKGGRSGGSSHQPTVVAGTAGRPLKDPVCGMTVTLESPHVLQHEGKPVYFCSSGCKAKFVANPAKYLVARSGSIAPVLLASGPAVDSAIYTCPMHPQIRQVGPGNCPICGMTLEPVTTTADVGQNPELVDMTRR